MNCFDCYYFMPKGEVFGYCELQERTVTINCGCDEGEEREEE